MKAKLIGTYRNGDYTISIFEDGTKIRYCPDEIINPQNEFPESCDLRICNVCSLGCPMCHEQSTPDGVIGDLNNPILDTLHPYTELAIGGGNPLEHPDIVEFLQRMKDKKVICNLTVNLEHFLKDIEVLRSWSDRKLIHGIGISVGRTVTKEEAYHIAQFPNSIVHVIAGLCRDEILESLAGNNIKLLILGYKKVGRGIGYYNANKDRIDYSIKHLSESLCYWRHEFELISFDNLALEQLDVRSLVSEEQWNESYMGEDGQYTMYMDLCNNEYAVASTMERHQIPENIKTIDELFALVKAEAIRLE